MESNLLSARRRQTELYFDCGSQQGAKRDVQDKEVQDRRTVHGAALQAYGLGGCANDVLAAGRRKGNLSGRLRLLSPQSSKVMER